MAITYTQITDTSFKTFSTIETFSYFTKTRNLKSLNKARSKGINAPDDSKCMFLGS